MHIFFAGRESSFPDNINDSGDDLAAFLRLVFPLWHIAREFRCQRRIFKFTMGGLSSRYIQCTVYHTRLSLQRVLLYNRETYATINFDPIYENINFFHWGVSRDTKLFCTVTTPWKGREDDTSQTVEENKREPINCSKVREESGEKFRGVWSTDHERERLRWIEEKGLNAKRLWNLRAKGGFVASFFHP